MAACFHAAICAFNLGKKDLGIWGFIIWNVFFPRHLFLVTGN